MYPLYTDKVGRAPPLGKLATSPYPSQVNDEIGLDSDPLVDDDDAYLRSKESNERESLRPRKNPSCNQVVLAKRAGACWIADEQQAFLF